MDNSNHSQNLLQKADDSQLAVDSLMPNHLQNLPQELLEWTAQYLASPELFNLRLTCKDMASRTTKYMARRYFREIYGLMMDLESMLRLMEICAHPVYKRSIRVISFNIGVLEDEECNHHYKSYEPGEPEDGWQPWITTSRQQSVYDLHIRFRSLVKTAIYVILNHCHLHGINPEIRTLQCGFYAPDYKGPWGAHRLERELGGRRLIWGSRKMEQKAYAMLLHGISTLGHEFAHFDPWTLVEVIVEFDVREPFRHLTHLDLNLTEQKVHSWERNVEARLRDIEAHVYCIKWMISQAESLETLSLTCQNNYIFEENRSCDSEFFKALAVDDALPDFEKPLKRIKNLKLEGHDIPKHMLLDFVKEHQSTLQSLDLWEIIDGQRDDRGMKNDLFEAASGIVDFRLRMGRVYEGTRAALYSNHEGWAPTEWEGLDPWGEVVKVD